MKSSCIKACKLDPTKTYCIGCNRTLEQIKEAGNDRKGR